MLDVAFVTLCNLKAVVDISTPKTELIWIYVN